MFEDSGTSTDWTRSVGLLSFLIGLGIIRWIGKDWSGRILGFDADSMASKQEPNQRWSSHTSSDQDEILVPVYPVYKLIRQPLILSAFFGSALCGALASTITIYYLFGGTKEWDSFLSTIGLFIMGACAVICLAFSYIAMDLALPNKTTRSNPDAIRNRALLGAIIGIVPGCIATAIFVVLFLGILV